MLTTFLGFDLGKDYFEPVVYGNNTCYMVQGYYPKAELEAWLPANMTIPDDATMQANYDYEPIEGQHPFMLQFCHCAHIHDKFTMKDLPEQEELMFLFPVTFTGPDGKGHLMSYSPVLYLNSSIGVIGGLYYGLRKEYNPSMRIDVPSDHEKAWSVPNIIKGTFKWEEPVVKEEGMPQFFVRTWTNPVVSISYPPFPRPHFYQAAVYPVGDVFKTTEDWEWDYRGSTLKSGENTSSVYAAYWFTMSWPMNYEQITSRD